MSLMSAQDAELATLSAGLASARAELAHAQQQQAQLDADVLAATQQARLAVDNARRQRSREANAQRVLKAKSCSRSGLRDDYCVVADELQQAKRQQARLERCAANLTVVAEQWAERAQQARQQVGGLWPVVLGWRLESVSCWHMNFADLGGQVEPGLAWRLFGKQYVLGCPGPLL